ncbi:HAD family hydrolase [Streptomyces spororaveus]|uniref:HAD family hydrolase n=1 Tax=Streptomyces spororaveus TaxID=284039 RepID=UPI0027E39B01|nr:HAD family hydrolase [Streptomyces spororaveus]
MIKPAELVIFDCDGVLVDTERIALRIQLALGAELGWPLTPEDAVDRFIGRSKESICEQIAQRLGPQTAALWWQELLRRHREAVDTGLEAVDGLPGALEEITLPVCVASSGSHDKMRHTLGVTGLYERFAGRIFSAAEVARGKPAPDLFLHAARQMGADPAACVVVEDSLPGVLAARAAGMRALAYAGGLTPPHRLTGPATVVFTDMRELPGLLTGSPDRPVTGQPVTGQPVSGRPRQERAGSSPQAGRTG